MSAQSSQSTAVQFCNELVSNTTLQNAYVQALVAASKNPSNANQTLDTFFSQQGFSGCTMSDVAAAQKQIPAYSLGYWAGTYQMTGSGTSAAGSQLTIAVGGNNQVSLGSTSIAGYTFGNLVLSWNNGPANAASGQLMFNTTPATDGTSVNGFNGVINGADVDGTQTSSSQGTSAPPKKKKSTAAKIAGDALQIAALFLGEP